MNRHNPPDRTYFLKQHPTDPTQDSVASITYAEYVLAFIRGTNALGIGLDQIYSNAELMLNHCKDKAFRSQEWQTCIRQSNAWYTFFWEAPVTDPNSPAGAGLLHDIRRSDLVYRASAYAYDTIYNPLADCSANLRLCNPSRSTIPILASLEGHALFYEILRGNKPWKSILNADYRMSNRFLEWARFYTEVEPHYIIAGQLAGTLKTKVWTSDRVSLPQRTIAGDWNSPDIMEYLNGTTVTPQLEWFRFETSPEKFNTGTTLASNHLNINGDGLHNPDTDGVSKRYDTSTDGYRLNKDWLNYFGTVMPKTGSAPTVGILSSSTFLNVIPRDRSRANRALQFATCEGFPPAIGLFQSVESESKLPPRQRVRSGCAGCHNEGGVDPMARFFMGYANSRVEETDGNINFSEDPINYYGFNQDITKPLGWMSGRPMGLATFGYVKESTVIALNRNGYYGRDRSGTSTDSWKGNSVDMGIKGLSRVLLEEPKFTLCAVKNAWRVAFGRDPTTRESLQVATIAKKLQSQGDYSFQDAVKEVVMSPAFGKDY